MKYRGCYPPLILEIMKLTKRQIQKINSALKQAEKAENMLVGATGNLAFVIIEATGVDGHVDHLHGDGFGFTPLSNNHTHIIIEHLIKMAQDGIEITEAVILDNLTI
jgi:hypothetical protein